MKNVLRSLITAVIFCVYAAVSIIPAAKEAGATAISSVSYNETWDGASSQWDYEYYVSNQSDDGENLYYLFLDMFGFDATLTNISSPAGWEYFSDDSTYIEWISIPATGSEIAPGSSFVYLFSSDKQLGDIYNDVLFDDGSIVNGTSVHVTAAASVPEPATMLLLGSGLLMVAGIKKKNCDYSPFLKRFKILSVGFAPRVNQTVRRTVLLGCSRRLTVEISQFKENIVKN